MPAEEKMDLWGKVSSGSTKVILLHTYNINAHNCSELGLC